jgi:hypothetical protein
MATIVNTRDVKLQAASPRVLQIQLPPNVVVPGPQVLAVTISASDAYFRTDEDGNNINDSIVLTALLPTGITGFVTWSKTGTGSIPPEAGTTNTWTIYAADQTGDSTTYTASIVSNGTTYTASREVSRIRNGLTGERGPNGVPGTLHGYGKQYGITTSSFSNDLANRVIYNMLTNETSTSPMSQTSHLLLGDTVTLNDSVAFVETRFWTGETWEILDLVLDGNLLVNGTVSATKLTAGSFFTGQNANASISIGDTTFLGGLKSPFHIQKVTAASGQVLISALNNKDGEVAIWGATAGTATGNAVSGTYSKLATDVTDGVLRYAMIGLMGSDTYGGGVAGVAYGYGAGGVFQYLTASASLGSGDPARVLKYYAKMATENEAGLFSGPVSFGGTASPLILNGSAGTVGQVPVSQGPGATPVWGSGGGGGALTYASLQSVVSGSESTSALSVDSTIRSTSYDVPAAGTGLELAYGTVGSTTTAWIMSYDRTANAARSMRFIASDFTFDGGSAYFVQSPTSATPATSDNTTKLSTTAYVVSRIAQDAPSKTGSGASGTWAINVSGSAATVTSLTAAQVQAALAAATTATTVSSTLRATGLTPTGMTGAGIELSYGTNGTTGGFITAVDRSTSANKPITFIGSSFIFDSSGTASFANNPTITSNNYTNYHSGNLSWSTLSGRPTSLSSFSNDMGYVTSSGSVSYATSSGNASTVGNIRVVGGSGNIGTFSTGLSSIQGLSIICTDPYYAIVTGVSGGTVTCICRDYNGNNGGAQGMRWIATGT